MRTGVILMSDGAHLIVQSATDGFRDFRERVARTLIDAVQERGIQPVQMLTASGPGFDLAGEGPAEIYELLRVKLALWDGNAYVSAPSGAAYFIHHGEAAKAAKEVAASAGRAITVRPIGVE